MQRRGEGGWGLAPTSPTSPTSPYLAASLLRGSWIQGKGGQRSAEGEVARAGDRHPRLHHAAWLRLLPRSGAAGGCTWRYSASWAQHQLAWDGRLHCSRA